MSGQGVKLSLLMDSLDVLEVRGNPDVDIHGISIDSREVKPGCLFVAIVGQRTDGHEFIAQALGNGAKAIVGSRLPAEDLTVPFVLVKNSSEALALISSRFFGDPSCEFRLVGITGTNGKTTLTYLLESIAKAAGLNPGVIGTVDVRYLGNTESTPHTTPQAPQLQSLFRRMAQQGVDVVFMEVSSHGLELDRVLGSNFDVGVFTNLTRDHLDFHGGMERYAQAKALLFNRELIRSKAENKVAVINAEDPMRERVVSGWNGRIIRFGLHDDADVYPSGPLKSDLEGIETDIRYPSGLVKVRSRMVGKHNLENMTAAVAVARALDMDQQAIGKGISSCPVVPGRLERVDGPAGSPSVFVDYAHTDDALTNVISALAPLTSGRLIVVFGCGGDRDKGKRPLMGKAVAKGADLAVVTSDNPRTEDPLTIIDQILPGLLGEGFKRVSQGEFGLSDHVFAVEENRCDAIDLALRAADEDDVVLIAGKGHETYQLVGDQVLDFDDRIIAAELLVKIKQARMQ